MKFKAPKQFDLGGYTFSVQQSEMQRTGVHGLTNYDKGEIWLDDRLEPEDLKAITFYHEWFHAAFNAAGRDDLRNDEGLVDLMGSFMWQLFKSAKF